MKETLNVLIFVLNQNKHNSVLRSSEHLIILLSKQFCLEFFLVSCATKRALT